MYLSLKRIYFDFECNRTVQSCQAYNSVGLKRLLVTMKLMLQLFFLKLIFRDIRVALLTSTTRAAVCLQEQSVRTHASEAIAWSWDTNPATVPVLGASVRS